MRLLLDTHVLIWLAAGMAELGTAGRRRIEAAAARDGVLVSAITFWEVAMIEARGRLSLAIPMAEWRERVLAQPGIQEIQLDGACAIESVALPGALHADPADRLLAATARVHGLRLATRDARLLAYGNAGHLATLAV